MSKILITAWETRDLRVVVDLDDPEYDKEVIEILKDPEHDEHVDVLSEFLSGYLSGISRDVYSEGYDNLKIEAHTE